MWPGLDTVSVAARLLSLLPAEVVKVIRPLWLLMWHIVIITAALHNYNLPCYQRLWRFTWKDYVLCFVTTLQVSKLDVNEDRIQLAHSVHLIEDFFSPKGEEFLKYSAYEVYRNIMRNTCGGKCGLIILADFEGEYI